MRWNRVGVSIALALVAAGCSGGGGIKKEELRSVVLQPADVPAVFLRFDEGRQTDADAPPGERADPLRFGREEGWKARYRRPGSERIVGPLDIESRVDLFGGKAGARKDLKAHREQIQLTLAEAPGRGRLLESPELGEEAIAMTLRERTGLRRVRVYLIAWREANVTASIFVHGFDGRLGLAPALQFARKQARRIERHTEG